MKQVMVGLTTKQIRWLDKQCKHFGISRSEYLRRVIDACREVDEKEKAEKVLLAAATA